MAEPTNYPDVLGYISGGARADYGVLQAVAAVQPYPAKAGKPVTVTVILQNMTDAPLEVLAVLTVPQRDLAGKSAAFVANVQRLAIGMQPCEVGLLMLPLLTQPGTAPGIYRFSLQMTAKATGKGSRIRLAEGGGAFYMGALVRQQQLKIEALRSLRYAAPTPKRGLFGSGAPTLEAVLSLEPGGLGGVLDRKADYHPLWSRRDLKEDPRKLMERHRDALLGGVLPALDRTRLLQPLTTRTIARFKEAGYELTELEASMIARVMTLILEYSCTGQLSYGRKFLLRPEYDVLPRLGIARSASRTTGSIPIVKADGTRQTGSIPIVPPSRQTGGIPIIPAKQTGSLPVIPPARQTGTLPVIPPTKQTGTLPVVPPTKQTGSLPTIPPTKQTGALPVIPPTRQTGTIPIQSVPPMRLRWLEEFLAVMEEDERAAKFVSRYLPERCYDALLRDAFTYALREVESINGMDLGSDDELEIFADEWMDKLDLGVDIKFSDVYMPLALAEIIIHDDVLLPDENVKMLHEQFQEMLEHRAGERTEENSPLFELTYEALDDALRKYGLGL